MNHRNVSSVLRTLAPAHPTPANTGSSAAESGPWLEPAGNDAATKLRRRRNSARKACQLCRSAKRRCDGKAPRCTPCSRRNLDCSYTLDQSEELHEARVLLQRLKEAPESEALDLLLRLRALPDLKSVLSLGRSGDGPNRHHRPSEIATARGLLHFARSDIEVELGARHVFAYPIPTLGTFAQDSATILKRHVLPICGERSVEVVDQGTSDATVSCSAPPSAVQQGYCDERLGRLEIGYWTGIPIPNTLAAEALSTYFELSHPLLGLFDADLFLNDLVDQGLEFCSAFLVSAVLGYACQSHTGINMSASPFAAAFVSDAERMWRAERSTDTVLNVASIFMLSLSSHTYLGNLQTLELLEDGRRMAERLGLFNVRPADGANRLVTGDAEQTRAAAHVAHGSYCWLTLNTFYCRVEPIDYPPLLGIPGSDTAYQTIESPGNNLPPPHHTPGFMERTCITLCGFWSIMQEVAAVYFVGGENSGHPEHSVPVAFAESQYQKLLAWSDALGEDMALSEGCPDYILIFHILFHCAVLDIFEPFRLAPRNHRLRSFSSRDGSINAVLRASTNQLKRLILECRLHRPRTLLVAHTNSALLHVGNTMLRDAVGVSESSLSDPDCRLYFLLALANCREMFVCFPVFGSIGRGLLSMAMRDGLLDSTVASSLIAAYDARGMHHDVSVRRPGGSFIIDFELATREHEKARAVAIAQEFESWSIFSDFITPL